MKYLRTFTCLAFSLLLGCQTQSQIEKLAAQAVVEQNARLPIPVGHSIQLVKVSYDPLFNEFSFLYSVADRRKFDLHYKVIEYDLSSRVHNDNQLHNLFKQRVKMVHKFQGGAREGEMSTHTEFVTER